VATAVLDRLKAATRFDACVADTDVFACLGDFSRERYVDYLVRSFCFEEPFECACVMTPALARYADPASWSRTRFIAEDLIALGLPAEKLLELTPCPLGAFEEVSDALGWLFVAEHNVKTNSVVHQQMLQRAPGIAAVARYLRCYGTATGARWRAFGASLDQAVSDGASEDRMIEAARAAFDFFHRWLQPEPPAATVEAG
jgi:heme oxygenase